MNVMQKLGTFVLYTLVAGSLVASAVAQEGEKAGAKRILVRAGHVLDVKTGKLSDSMTIVVVGDSIQSVAADGFGCRAAG